MNTTVEKFSHLSQTQISDWFENAICELQGDKFMIENNLANPETQRMYTALINDDTEYLMQQMRDKVNENNIQKLVVKFVSHLIPFNDLPNKLAFSVSDSKVFIWAEVDDDNELAEDAILISEAKVNAVWYDKGYCVSSTIVEKIDKVAIPSHYINIPIDKIKAHWEASQTT